MFKTIAIIFLLLLACVPLQAQRGNIWCFGDSAALDFNGGAPVPSTSSIVSRGGSVTQKNVQLLNFLMVDCILAIKHGNGRDWWLMVRPSPVGQPTDNNTWLFFLITPFGITAAPPQNLGNLNGTNSGSFTSSPDGSRISFINLGGTIELFDFERCTGILSSPQTIEPPLQVGPYPYYWSSEFSTSGRYLYVSSLLQINSKLWQYDTWSPNIFATKTLIWQTPGPPFTAGALKRGPDNKIYFSCAWFL
ncbi:MAG: hypothetical protein IPG39_20675 [Bacteroidetes bacterium]|nr:hypothetical protein [Bacteroidota bacterium]